MLELTMSQRSGRRLALLSVVGLLALAGCGGGDGDEQLTPAETALGAQAETGAAADVTDTAASGSLPSAGFTLAEDVLLAEDSAGDDVVRLQEALTRLGYDPGPANGTFGRKTRQAVLRFQREHDLDADGIVGPLTAAAIDEALQATG